MKHIFVTLYYFEQMGLREKIINGESGIVFYGLTPPKINTEEDKIREIAQKQIERIKNIDIDGLILYDLQDESARNPASRPFPFQAAMQPDEYGNRYLNSLDIPRIIYKSVGKFTESSFEEWVAKTNSGYVVLVGTPSKNHSSGISLKQAYKISRKYSGSFIMGGVTIPERHKKSEDEHLRILNKSGEGCRFFVSQCIYDVYGAKNFLSDYYYSCIHQNKKISPIIFSLTPCGSVKTLEFTKWLGIEIPKWLENDLKYSGNTLTKSVEACKNIAKELADYCLSKNIPAGFNIESVAIRKEEIEASIELVKWIRSMF